MKKFILLLAVIFIVHVVYSEDIAVSVADFTVESAQDNYKYIGKGISRLVAGELRNTGGLTLVERDRILKIIDEQKFSLSGLADESQQIEIGRMLSAKYIVLGEIIDMMSSFLISVRLVDVETGKVVWQEERSENLQKYDYVGAFFASGIAEALELTTAASTVSKIEKPVEKNVDAVIELSAGIAAYDEGDKETAKQKFESAKTLDPESAVASYYLSKLITNSAKFMVTTPPFYSYQNPAYLGILKSDRLHFNISQSLDTLVSLIAGGDTYETITDSLSIMEYDSNMSLGYYFPVGNTMGLGVELFLSILRNDIKLDGEQITSGSGRFGQGGMLSYGISVTDWLSLGISGALFNLSNSHPIFAPTGADVEISEADFSAIGGMLLKNRDETLLFDLRGGYSSASFIPIDTVTYEDLDKVHIPVLVEDTLTMAFNEKRTFVVIKNLNELGLDNQLHYIRLMPAVEQFFTDSFSLRAAVEGAGLISGTNEIQFGYGIMGGFTLRFLKAGIDLDVNFTHRLQPSRMVDGFLYPNTLLLVNLSFNDLFISREE